MKNEETVNLFYELTHSSYPTPNAFPKSELGEGNEG
jgi:hypothetical protein